MGKLILKGTSDVVDIDDKIKMSFSQINATIIDTVMHKYSNYEIRMNTYEKNLGKTANKMLHCLSNGS